MQERYRTYTLPRCPEPLTIASAAALLLITKGHHLRVKDVTETYAGGRGTEFATHTAVIAKPCTTQLFACKVDGTRHLPTYPQAIRKSETYLAAIDIVDKDITKPRMTPHHQTARWKNRSPVLSTSQCIKRS